MNHDLDPLWFYLIGITIVFAFVLGAMALTT